MNMTLDSLNKAANAFLNERYGLNLNVPIVINNRFKSIMGAVVYSNSKGIIKIEMAESY